MLLIDSVCIIILKLKKFSSIDDDYEGEMEEPTKKIEITPESLFSVSFDIDCS